MAQFKVEWSKEALEERIDILSYWFERTGSTSYSNKLNAMIVEAIQLLASYPLMGKSTNLPDVRVKVVGDYLLIYRVDDQSIQILAL
ncbi:MAG: type II toxin-antitoxin system RelE/ParE family toxin [Cyclobacteriaceae bacterium]